MKWPPGPKVANPLDPPSHEIIQPAPSRTFLVMSECIEVASFPPRCTEVRYRLSCIEIGNG